MHKPFLATSMAMAIALTGGIWAFSDTTDGDDKNPEEKALVQTVEALVDAYNRGDAPAIAALWSEDSIYIGAQAGERLKGRSAIEKDYAAQMARDKGGEMAIALDVIRMITSDVANMEGTAKFYSPKGPGTENTFVMLLVKKEGKWLIDSVRETETAAAPSHYEYLKDLEWMIGEWINREKDTEVSIVCSWATNRNFMNRFFTVKVKDVIEHQGTQVVGWDPVHNRIRSWVFDEDGMYGDGVWQRDGNRWIVKVNGVLPGARRSTATQIITRVENNKYTWQQQSRAVDGRPLPNSDEVTLTRVTSKEKE